MKIYRHLTANDVRLEPFPFQRELSMQAYLIENQDILRFDDDHRNVFSDVEIIDDELSLKSGRKSKDTDGRIDILATYSQEYIAIVELKLGELNDSHLEQLEDYLKEKNKIPEIYPDKLSKDLLPNPKWIGVLVGASINPELEEKLIKGYTTGSDKVPIAALTVQRFRGSDGSVLVTTDTYFSPPAGRRDNTRYIFEGKAFGKSGLVLAIVKDYAAKNSEVTYSELTNAFPKTCQGAAGVIEELDKANEIARKGKRHFLNQADIIRIKDDVKVVVSNQWGIGNINRFIEQAKKLGYQIDTKIE